jgi:steroid delta-isomerase-like uncharacterized protein
MSFDVSALAKNWSAAGTGADVAAQYTEDAVRVDLNTGTRTAGRAALAAYAQVFHDACPDAVLTVRRQIEAGDTVVVEWTWEGTHTGNAEGWPADGAEISVAGCAVLDIDHGLIRLDHSYWDRGFLG